MKSLLRCMFGLALFVSLIAWNAPVLLGQAEQTSAETAKILERQKAEAARQADQAQAQAEAKKAQQEIEEVRRRAQIEQTEAMKALEQQRAETQRQMAELEIVIKTYALKYINPNELMQATRFYVVDSTSFNNVLTVRIRKKDIAAFEELLKKLDVERKNIQFQIYTIIASRGQFSEDYVKRLPNKPSADLENHDLKKVFDELKGLWNFKAYYMDNPSFITLKDGSGPVSSRLVSSLYNFDIELSGVQIRGDEAGKRPISVGRIQLNQNTAERGATLIETKDLSIKENGYLVVGVSGFNSLYSPESLALILIIRAEIK